MSAFSQPNGQARRIIVVGLGSIGRRHVRLLRGRSDLRVEVCEPSSDARNRATPEIEGLTVHADFGRALATRPDMLLIATPHSLHAKQAIAGLQSGAHVLCEKPLCMAADEAVRMVACARDSGRTLAVGFQLHFQPCMIRARQIVRSGTIGNVVHAHARVGSYIILRNCLSRYQETIEGSLLWDYSHQPDLLFWLLDELPCGVSLTGLKGGNLPLSSEPNVLALTLDYDRPLLATVHLNYVQMPQCQTSWKTSRFEHPCRLEPPSTNSLWYLYDTEGKVCRVGRFTGHRRSTCSRRSAFPVMPATRFRHPRCSK